MKSVKIIVLLATAFGACAAPAAATVLTSPAGSVYDGQVTAEPHGSGPPAFALTAVLGGASGCDPHLRFEVTSPGSQSETVKASVEQWKLDFCDNSVVSHIRALGTLEIHTRTASPDGNGTLTSSGLTIELTNLPQGTCSFRTNNTDIGILTGSRNTGGRATIDMAGAIPSHAGSAFCGPELVIEGSLEVTTPTYLDVD